MIVRFGKKFLQLHFELLHYNATFIHNKED